MISSDSHNKFSEMKRIPQIVTKRSSEMKQIVQTTTNKVLEIKQYTSKLKEVNNIHPGTIHLRYT